MKSLQGIRAALTAAVAAHIIANLAAIGHFIAFAWTSNVPQHSVFENRFATIAEFSSAAFWASCAILLIWTHSVAANLSAARLLDLVYTPKWNVWGFVIPVVNFVRPHDVMAEIWRASRFLAAPQQYRSWRDVPNSRLVLAWWIFFTIGGILSLLQITGPFNVSPAQLLSLSPIYLIRIVAGVLTIIVVRHISSLHEQVLARA